MSNNGGVVCGFGGRCHIASMQQLTNMASNKMPDSYIPPNITPKCTWALGKPPSDSPHHHVEKK